jgi:beta-galactosidase
LAGPGATFAGQDYIRVPVADPVLKPANRLFVSSWFKTTDLDRYGSNILSMGDNYNLRLNSSGRARFTLYDGDHHVIVESDQANLEDGAWHHLAGVFDGSHLIIYVDGQERGRKAKTGSIRYDKQQHFIIGAHGAGRPEFDFLGSLDEIVVSSEIRSAEWIKLSYESQRPDSRLLEFQ